MAKKLLFVVLTLCVAQAEAARAAEPEGVTEWVEGEEPVAQQTAPAAVEAPAEPAANTGAVGTHADLPAASSIAFSKQPSSACSG